MVVILGVFVLSLIWNAKTAISFNGDWNRFHGTKTQLKYNSGQFYDRFDGTIVITYASNKVDPDEIAMNSIHVNNKDQIANATLSGFKIFEKEKFLLESVAILTIYFVQGALGLSQLATSYFLKDELNLSPSEVATFSGLTTIPWVVKPLYGFLSDGLPLFGYRRRSYLVLSGAMGCFAWLGLATASTSPILVLGLIILGSASVAIGDVIADSIVVEKSRKFALESKETIDENINENANNISGEIQSLCWGASAVGGILSAYFSGSLLEFVPPRTVFLITSFFPLLVGFISFFIQEQPVSSSKQSINHKPLVSYGTNYETSSNEITSGADGGLQGFSSMVSERMGLLGRTITNPAIFLPVLFVFLWRSTPSPDSAMFFFSVNELAFKPEFLGRVGLISNVAALAGIVVYNRFLKTVSIKNMILWSTLISVPLSLTQVMLVTHFNREIGIPDQAFVLTDSAVLSVLGRVSFMPTLVLASNLCPPGIEGTLFATLMSIYNAANIVSAEFGGLATSYFGVTENNFEALPLLIIFCSFASAVPLIFINFLDKKYPNFKG